MSTTSIAISAPRGNALKTILTAGLLAGVLDGLDAIVYFGWFRKAGVGPLFQYIASGLLGEASFREGGLTIALGVVLQLFIATGAAAVYYAITRVMPTIFGKTIFGKTIFGKTILDKPILGGTIFGLAVFFIMHYIVVPLSAVPGHSATGLADYLSLIISHIFFVGLPIAIVTSRASNR
jgi:hypothetical protein